MPDSSESSSSATLIQKLYEHQNKLVVVGVTGYTGSGCKSVANILRDGSFTDCAASDIYNQNRFDEIKFQSAVRFLGIQNNSFRSIKISHIILCMCFFATIPL